MMNMKNEVTLVQFSVSYVHHNNSRICKPEAIAVNYVVLLLLHSHYWSFVKLTRLKHSGL